MTSENSISLTVISLSFANNFAISPTTTAICKFAKVQSYNICKQDSNQLWTKFQIRNQTLKIIMKTLIESIKKNFFWQTKEKKGQNWIETTSYLHSFGDKLDMGCGQDPNYFFIMKVKKCNEQNVHFNHCKSRLILKKN